MCQMKITCKLCGTNKLTGLNKKLWSNEWVEEKKWQKSHRANVVSDERKKSIICGLMTSTVFRSDNWQLGKMHERRRKKYSKVIYSMKITLVYSSCLHTFMTVFISTLFECVGGEISKYSMCAWADSSERSTFLTFPNRISRMSSAISKITFRKAHR